MVDITFDLMAKIGKKPAKIKKESLGFVGNRLQLAVLREAFYIVQQGIADAATVDDVMKYSLGRRWNLVGPLASIDLGGLDVFYNISTYLFDDMDNGTGPSPLLAEKVKEGNFGAKTGQGFFSWQGEDGKRIIETRNKALLRALKDDAADSTSDYHNPQSNPQKQQKPHILNQSRSIRAVRAQRMLTTSMASWRKAPTTTGIRLNAAAIMPMVASTRPAITA